MCVFSEILLWARVALVHVYQYSELIPAQHGAIDSELFWQGRTMTHTPPV